MKVRRAIVFMIAALAGCAEDRAPSLPGGEIRVAINSDIMSTNPGVLRDGNTDMVLYHIGESLVAYRDDMTVAPLLAEAVSWSPDRRTYTFTLRRGVRFHNGATMDASHVLWTWRRLLDPRTGFRCIDDYNGKGPAGIRIEAIEAPAPDRVIFRLNRPSALFLDRMASVQCQTPILHPSSVDADGRWRMPVGTGPYRLGVWRRGRDVTVERFSGYSPRSEPMSGLTGRKVAHAGRVVFVVTPDRVAAKSALYAGALDLVFAAPLSAHREMARREAARGDVRTYRQATMDWTVLLLQTRDPLLRDVRMRRAIAHALSGPLIAEVSTFGLARSNPSAVTRASRFHTAAEEVWPQYDPARARALASEAGYRGQPITIQANRKFPYMFDNAVAAQAMLSAAGFNVRIEMFDWATQLSNFQSGDFQISSFGYAARGHPALLFSNFTGPKDLRKSYQWEDAEAIRLIGGFESVDSDDKMRDQLARLHTRMVADVPMIGLYNDEIVDLTRTRLAGYKPWALGRPRLWNVRVAAEGAQ